MALLAETRPAHAVLTLRGVAIITCSYNAACVDHKRDPDEINVRMCRFSTGATSKMATSQFAVWAAAFGLFLVFQACWAQQGYAFYDMFIIFSYGVDILFRFGNAVCATGKSVTRSLTQVAYRNHIGHAPETGFEGVAGTDPCSNCKNSAKIIDHGWSFSFAAQDIVLVMSLATVRGTLHSLPAVLDTYNIPRNAYVSQLQL